MERKLGQGFRLGLVEDALFDPGEAFGVAVDNHGDAVAAAIGAGLGHVVKVGDGVRQVFHHRAVEAAFPGQPVEKRVFVETFHFDHPVDGLAVAVQGQGSVRLAGYCHHAQINRRRGAAVDPDFGLACQAALLGHRKIKIGKGNSAF